MSATLHRTQLPNGVVLLEIDSPPSNALGEAVRLQFEAEIDAIGADLSQRAVILTGRGTGFCAGDDLREATSRGGDAISSLRQFGVLLDKIESLRVPVIAAVNGHAIGGGLELALACDVRIASDKGWFLGAGVNVGLMASTYRLPRIVGVGPAKAMLLTGTRTDAETALRYGLVTAIHPAEALLDEAKGLADRIASRAPLSVEATKRTIGKAFDITPLEAAKLAQSELRTLVASEDHKIGVKAFLSRQEPQFTRS